MSSTMFRQAVLSWKDVSPHSNRRHRLFASSEQWFKYWNDGDAPVITSSTGEVVVVVAAARSTVMSDPSNVNLVVQLVAWSRTPPRQSRRRGPRSPPPPSAAPNPRRPSSAPVTFVCRKLGNRHSATTLGINHRQHRPSIVRRLYASSCRVSLMPVQMVMRVVGFGQSFGGHTGRQRQIIA